MDYSSPFLMGLRCVGRKLGVLRPVQIVWRKLRGEEYEQDFERALLNGIKPGDVVWDIGANIGFYTSKFADIVGPTGKVVGFEPSPETSQTLKTNCAGHPNVVCEQIALSDVAGEADFHIAAEANSPVSGLAQRSAIPVAQVCKVRVMTGDEFAAANPALAPSKMKIDVEGFELEVLRGMKSVLASPRLKAAYIEVHFSSLAERGLTGAPTEIAAMLKEGGFKVRWTDASHIEAIRAGQG